MYQVGDQVVLTDKSAASGDIGTVVETRSDGCYMVLIPFSKYAWGLYGTNANIKLNCIPAQITPYFDKY